MILTATICLALNIYYEAAYEPPVGQYAVALVTVNRSHYRHRSICKTVYQPHQFSWTDMDVEKPHGAEWKEAKRIAWEVVKGNVADFTGGANYYFADYVKKPTWAKHMIFIAKFGHHYFYKDKKHEEIIADSVAH